MIMMSKHIGWSESNIIGWKRPKILAMSLPTCLLGSLLILVWSAQTLARIGFIVSFDLDALSTSAMWILFFRIPVPNTCFHPLPTL